MTHRTIHLSEPSPHTVFARQWAAPGATRALTLYKRQKFVSLTAASGCLPNLELAVSVSGCMVTAEAWEAAAAKGHIHICEWLLQQDCGFDDCVSIDRQWGDIRGDALSAAAVTGRRDVCEWLLSHAYPWSSEALGAAACTGHMDLMEWLLERRPTDLQQARGLAGRPLLYALLSDIADGFDLPTLQRLHRELLEGPDESAPPAGLRRRLLALPEGSAPGPAPAPAHPAPDPAPAPMPAPAPAPAPEGDEGEDIAEAVEWHRSNVLPYIAASPAPDWRAKMEWLEARGYPRSAVVAAVVAQGCNEQDALERLAWLAQRGGGSGGGGGGGSYAADGEAFREAARLGKLAVLGRLLAEGAPATHAAAVAAAEGGHLAALKALHAAGCDMEPAGEVLRAAARRGQLGVVVWLVDRTGRGAAEQQALLDEAAFAAAARSGSVVLMTWLRGRGCPWDGSAFSAAAAAGCVAALEWLVEKGCPRPAEAPFLPACECGDFATLRCLRRLGFSWGPAACLFTACVGSSHVNPRVLRWLLHAGCPVDWDAATEAAGGAGWLVDWLAEQRRGQRRPKLQAAQVRRQRRRQEHGRWWNPATVTAAAAAAAAAVAAVVVIPWLRHQRGGGGKRVDR